MSKVVKGAAAFLTLAAIAVFVPGGAAFFGAFLNAGASLAASLGLTLGTTGMLLASAAVGAALGGLMELASPSARAVEQQTGYKFAVTNGIDTYKIIYGRAVVGGDEPFIDEYDAVGQNDVPNDRLIFVRRVADHPIEGFGRFWMGDKELSFGADGKCTTSPYQNKLQVLFFDGTQTAMPLRAKLPGWDQANGIGLGCAGFVVKSNFDQEIFPYGASEVRGCRVEVFGKKIYDPRKDSTVAGGSGAHRADNPATWEYSTNLPLCWMDWMRADIYRDQRSVVPMEEIDLSSVIAAANLADQDQPLKNGGSEKRYTCNGVADTAQNKERVAFEILASMAGRMLYMGGRYFINSPQLDFPDQHFDEGSMLDFSYQAYQKDDQVYNEVAGTFVDPDNDFEVSDVPVQSIATAQANEGPRRMPMNQPYTQSHTQAQRVNLIELKRSRLPILAAETGGLGVAATPGSVHNFSYNDFGISQFPVRISKQSINLPKNDAPLTVSLEAIEENPWVYEWNPASDELDLVPKGGFSARSGTSTVTVQGAALGVETDQDNDGSSFPVLVATWSAAGAYVQVTVIDFRKVGDTGWRPGVQSAHGETVGKIPVTVAGDYEVRIRHRLSNGVLGPETIAGPVTVTAAQASVAATATNANAVDWSNVQNNDGNRPENNADVTADNTAADTTNVNDIPASEVTDALAGVGLIDPVGAELALDLAASLRTRIDLIDAPQTGLVDLSSRLQAEGNILKSQASAAAKATTLALLQASNLQSQISGAGITVDAETGVISLETLKSFETQMGLKVGEAFARLDAAEGTIELSATMTEVNQAIAAAQLDPSELAALDDLILSVNTVTTGLDAANAAINLKADKIYVDSTFYTQSQAAIDIDALNQSISTKVNTVDFTDAEGRVTDIETELSALDVPAITQTVRDVRGLRLDSETQEQQTLQAMLQAWEDGENIKVDIASAQTQLTAKITDDRQAVATATQSLQGQINNAVGEISEEKKLRIEADQAEATAREQLAVQVGENTSGLQTEVQTRVDEVSALTVRTETLEATVNSPTTGLASRASISSVETAQTSANNAATAAANAGDAAGDAQGQVTALAQTVGQHRTTLDNHTSSIETVSESFNGISARHMIKLDVNGRVGGFVVGAEAGQTGEVAVAAVFAVDNFSIVDPSDPDNTNAVSFFEATPQGIRAKAAYFPVITADKIQLDDVLLDTDGNGNLTIKNEAIGTTKLINESVNEVTEHTFSDQLNIANNAWVTVATLNLSKFAAENFDFRANFSPDFGSGAYGFLYMRLRRGATDLNSDTTLMPDGKSDKSFTALDISNTAGTFNYNLQVKMVRNTYVAFHVRNISIKCIRNKK